MKKGIALVFISEALLTKVFWAILGYAKMSEAALDACRGWAGGMWLPLGWAQHHEVPNRGPAAGGSSPWCADVLYLGFTWDDRDRSALAFG